MSKYSENHEDDIMREFSEMESAPLGTTVPQREPVTDLGSVKMPTIGHIDPAELEKDPEIRKMEQLTNYVPLEMESMPTQGRFYAKNVRIYIRAARVGEVREYSMMDETNPNDVIEKMNYILASCSKVMFGNNQGSYKDIMDHDRFYVLMRIRELTFVNGETSISIPVPAGACKTPGCKHPSTITLRSEMLERPDPDPLLEKYYDEDSRCYSIRTKHYGVIQIAPPTVGVVNIVKDWAINRTQNNKQWDQSIIQMIPFFRREWRQLDDKAIFNLATEYEGWPMEKFTLIYRFIEKLNASVGMSPNIHAVCEACGGVMEIPVTFQAESDDGTVTGGFKQLFVQNISDRLDELL